MKNLFQVPSKLPGIGGRKSGWGLFGKASHEVVGSLKDVKTHTVKGSWIHGGKGTIKKLIGGG